MAGWTGPVSTTATRLLPSSSPGGTLPEPLNFQRYLILTQDLCRWNRMSNLEPRKEVVLDVMGGLGIQ